jgi:cytochrome b pre-mRNA-processing protein 3
MLRFLFPRLTAAPERGEKLFAAITHEARSAHWYLDGEVPDTIDGRFAMLTTIAALVMVRLDALGERAATAALTERFVEVMESEHRELGLGDPKLGRTVLRLVGALERRVGLWQETANSGDWTDAVRNSVYRDGEPEAAALEHTAAALMRFRDGLARVSAQDLSEGRLA